MKVARVNLVEIIREIRNGLDADQFDVPQDGDMLPISRIETIWNGEIDFLRVKYAAVTDLERERYGLRRGDILFSHINSPEQIGKTAIFHAERELIHGINLLLVRVDQKRCYPDYLNYYFKSFNVRALFRARCKRAVNQASLNQGDITSLQVPLPSLPEQQRIVARLDKADRLRRLRRYALDLGETYLQSVFLEMFGDPVKNPKRWPIGELEELCADVIDCPHATPKYAPEPTPYACVRSSDIQNGYFDWSTTQYVAEREYIERIARTVPLPNDVVYCREGARFGNAARIPDGQLVCLGQRTMLFRANCDVATPEFIWAFLESKSTYEQAVSWAGGSASPHVNVQDIKAFHTVKPPLVLQEKFAGVVRQYDRLRAQQRESLRQAEMLFGALLERTFEGEA